MTHPQPQEQNQRREDRGREAREAREPGSDAYALPPRGRANVNTLVLAILTIAMGGGGFGIYRSGDKLDKHAEAMERLTKTQSDVNSKVDVMTSLFTQVLTSQGKLESAQNVMARAQDDLRVEIAGLKASGLEGKVRDMDVILRKQGEDVAELKALLREKK